MRKAFHILEGLENKMCFLRVYNTFFHLTRREAKLLVEYLHKIKKQPYK